MADLFEAPAKPAPTRQKLHDETDIYRAVSELAMYIARTTANFRRDIKPTYGAMLADESARMAVLVREVNIARDAAKLPYLEEILRQVEYIKFVLKVLDELGQAWLPHKTYADSLPLTAAIGKQAMGLRNHFAPAP